MISLGDIKVSELYLGSTPIAEAYLGDEKVYPEESPEPPSSMSVQELIDNGYATLQNDYAASGPVHGGTYNPYDNSESDYDVIQIHSNCPVRLENITDFDTYLTSATTYVWREELPAGWTASALMNKYDGVQLARPPMEELFGGVVADDVENLSLTFTGSNNVGAYVCDASIVTERFNYSHYSQFKSPKNIEININGDYGTVAQCSFSELTTTTSLTINVTGFFSCHDVTGLFEYDYALKNLAFNGLWRKEHIRNMNNMFINCYELTSIPYVVGWGRDDESDAYYNTLYPRFDGIRGSADFGGAFVNLNKLTFLGPRINMNAASLSGCTAEGYNQSPLSGPTFVCPLLEDVRIINLNNNDWNFADNSTYTYIPNMDTTSITYLLSHVADCTSTPHTVTFSSLHQSDVPSGAISSAAAKGWTVLWQNV